MTTKRETEAPEELIVPRREDGTPKPMEEWTDDELDAVYLVHRSAMCRDKVEVPKA